MTLCLAYCVTISVYLKIQREGGGMKETGKGKSGEKDIGKETDCGGRYCVDSRLIHSAQNLPNSRDATPLSV